MPRRTKAIPFVIAVVAVAAVLLAVRVLRPVRVRPLPRPPAPTAAPEARAQILDRVILSPGLRAVPG